MKTTCPSYRATWQAGRPLGNSLRQSGVMRSYVGRLAGHEPIIVIPGVGARSSGPTAQIKEIVKLWERRRIDPGLWLTQSPGIRN